MPLIKIKKTIFDQIFSMIIQDWKISSNLILLISRDDLPERYKELYDCLSLFTDIVDVNEIRNELNDENREFFDELMLMKNEIDDSKLVEEHVLKLIPMSRIAHKKELIQEWQNNPDDEHLLNKINNMLNKKEPV